LKGVPTVPVYTDPDTPTCFGIYHRRSVTPAGRRFSTNDAFLPKGVVRQRANLRVCLGVHVQKILFASEVGELRAEGVLVESEKGVYTVRARREIILCAGAIVTPQLLLLRYVVDEVLIVVVWALRNIYPSVGKYAFTIFPG
jgi:choline dehydrogenase-like flavoprotein